MCMSFWFAKYIRFEIFGVVKMFDRRVQSKNTICRIFNCADCIQLNNIDKYIIRQQTYMF